MCIAWYNAVARCLSVRSLQAGILSKCSSGSSWLEKAQTPLVRFVVRLVVRQQVVQQFLNKWNQSTVVQCVLPTQSRDTGGLTKMTPVYTGRVLIIRAIPRVLRRCHCKEDVPTLCASREEIQRFLSHRSCRPSIILQKMPTLFFVQSASFLAHTHRHNRFTAL